MNKFDTSQVEEAKRRNFNRRFGKPYGVKLLGLQRHVTPQGQRFADVDFVFPVHLTADEIGMMCEKIAKWFGGELYGTVNIDYSGKPSLSIVVELA